MRLGFYLFYFFQINTAALKASQVMKQVRVEHKEDLVVPFGVP